MTPNSLPINTHALKSLAKLNYVQHGWPHPQTPTNVPQETATNYTHTKTLIHNINNSIKMEKKNRDPEHLKL